MGSSVSTPGPVYLSAVNNVLKIERAEPPAFWSASEAGSTWEPSSGQLWKGSSGSCCQNSELTKVEKNISVQNGSHLLKVRQTLNGGKMGSVAFSVGKWVVFHSLLLFL